MKQNQKPTLTAPESIIIRVILRIVQESLTYDADEIAYYSEDLIVGLLPSEKADLDHAMEKLRDGAGLQPGQDRAVLDLLTEEDEA